MSLKKERKKTDILSIKSSLQKEVGQDGCIILLHQNGVSSREFSLFRKTLRERGVYLRVVKNTLARLAVQGTIFDFLSCYFYGPIAVVFSRDPIKVASSIWNFLKTNDKIKVICGVAQGKFLNYDEIEVLASLSTMKVRLDIINLVQFPLSSLISILLRT